MTSDIHEDDRQESGKYDPQDNPGTKRIYQLQKKAIDIIQCLAIASCF